MSEYVGDLGYFDSPAEITGFHWPGSGQWLPVNSRMLVVYGRNGAGKSFTLDTIRAALHGEIDRTPVAIHLRGHPYSWETGSEELGGKNATYDAIWDYWSQAPRLGLENRMDPVERDDPDLQPLALEVARAGSFILYPLGNGHFDVWAAADPAGSATARWVQIYQSTRDLMVKRLEADGGPDLVEAWQTGRWPQHVVESENRPEILFKEAPAELWVHPLLRAELGLPRPFLTLSAPSFTDEDDAADWWLADHFYTSPTPVPIAHVARARPIGDMTSAIRVLADSTAEGLQSRLGATVAGIGKKVVKAEAQTWADRLSAEATNLCRQTLLDGPALSVGQFGKPWTWAPGGALRWSATTDEDPRARPLDELSEGERRWAGLAADLAMTRVWAWGDQVFPLKEGARDRWAEAARRVERPVLVLDEPESHLHRAAEAHMAAALSDLVGGKISLAIVATHSPHLLDLPDAQVLRVSRRALQPLQDNDRDDLELLGLQPSDLLSITRVVLLVEGLHEELIFKGSIGDELARNGVRILPIRGATKLPQTLDSQVLFKFSSANIVAVVDNVDAGVVSEAWDRACQLAVTQGPEPALELLKSRLPGGSASEHLFIREWMFNAIQRGLQSRMTPWGLRKPDILDYLPVTALVPDAGKSSWEDLRQQHKRGLDTGSVAGKSFKDWLVKVKGADLSPGKIREGARAMPRPEEFTLLVHECTRAADDARRQPSL